MWGRVCLIDALLSWKLGNGEIVDLLVSFCFPLPELQHTLLGTEVLLL